MAKAGRPSDRIAPATFRVGLDTRGRTHLYRRSTHSIHVIADGERVHVTYLGDRSIRAWLRFIDEELCGWAERDYAYALGTELARALEDA